MSNQILIVFACTFLIHLINTLAYSVRIVGVRTGRVFVSFALFNILLLLARASHALQAPLLAKNVEQDLLAGTWQVLEVEREFRLLLLAAAAGSLTGILLSPTFRNVFIRVVERFQVDRSVPRLLIHSFSKLGVRQFRNAIRAPSYRSFNNLRDIRKKVPLKLALMNTVAVAILVTGGFAALFAAYTNPELRVTSSNLAPLITGIATILLLIFVDPRLSALTDDSIEGNAGEVDLFFVCVVVMVASHFVGTLLAQLLLLPAAQAIVLVAEFI